MSGRPPMTTYLFVTKPEYDAEAVALGEEAWWSCSKTTQIGDHALVYITGTGIQYEWRAVSDADPDDVWRYVCDVEYVRSFDPPISLAEIRDAVARDEWAPPYQNFRGLKSIIIPEDIAETLRGLRVQ